jgi:dihydroceramidase
MAGPRGDEGGGGGGGGFWGPVTASVDWCEPNYALSPFVAEFWNTLSNLPPVLVGALGFWAAWRRRGRSGATLQPRAVALSYWTLIVVFVGSIVFHATLTYAGQLLDELPMIYGVLYLHDALTPGASRLARAGLAALAVGVSIVMFVLRHSPLPLQLSYGTFVVSLVVRSFYLDHTLRGRLRRHLLGISFVSYGSGFAAWLLDQHFCARVQHLHVRTRVAALAAAAAAAPFAHPRRRAAARLVAPPHRLRPLRVDPVPRRLPPRRAARALQADAAGRRARAAVCRGAARTRRALSLSPPRGRRGSRPYASAAKRGTTRHTRRS